MTYTNNGRQMTILSLFYYVSLSLAPALAMLIYLRFFHLHENAKRCVNSRHPHDTFMSACFKTCRYIYTHRHSTDTYSYPNQQIWCDVKFNVHAAANRKFCSPFWNAKDYRIPHLYVLSHRTEPEMR